MTIQNKAYQPLVELCEIPEINKNGRDIDKMLGIICAISASPQSLDLADWFPLLWLQDGPSFSNENIARDFAAAVLQFYENCLANYQQSTPLSLPTELWLNEKNEVTAQGIAFASGYLSGFHSIEALWQELNLAPESESGQLLQTTMLLLSKMATANNKDPQMQPLFVQLPDMNEIISTLPSLLSVLGNFSVSVSNND
ncbi:MAG: yecA family protein [Psychromonas sp.]|jgi:yecA family protein|uniref:UPF0149 family protein n=1 Tax=Psychromonas sp. TaxID=1884585 RepID=UPI0039E47FF1